MEQKTRFLASGAPHEYAGRFVVAVLGLAMVGAACALGRELFGWRAGLAAAYLVAATPILLHWASAAYTDLPAGTYYTLALLFAWRMASRSGDREALLAGLLGGLAALTKNSALLIAPTMILIFSSSFENVPISYCNAADALGSSAVQKFVYVILPYSWRGIITGDTLVALMLAGNAVAVPGSVFDSARTLTAHIALVTAADFDSIEFRTIFACGILLYLITLIMVLAVRCLSSLKKEASP